MYFDALTLACLDHDLQRTILHGRVQKVLLPSPLAVGLEIYAQHERHYLLASAHAELGRIELSSEKLRRGVDKETGLLLLLRKYVRGAAVSSIQQPPYERILTIGFVHPEQGPSRLVIEIMGRHSNIILVNAQDSILDSVKRVGPQMSSVRPVLPHRAYLPPPPQDKLAPPDLTEYRLRNILDQQEPGMLLWRALVRGVQGTSPLLAREVVFRTMGPGRWTVGDAKEVGPLLASIRHILSPLESKDWQPTVAIDEGIPRAYAPYKLTHRGEVEYWETISGAIRRYTSAAAHADPYAAAKKPVHEVLVRARGQLAHRRRALEQALARARSAERWREWGEWTLSYAHTISPGQSELKADTGAGETLTIPLDPDLSASENAQAFFARYRKAQRAGEDVPRRLQETKLALLDLDQLETDLDLAANRPQIEEVRRALAKGGYLKRKKRPTPKDQSQPITVRSPDRLLILIGRNSRQNDEVTFRRAKGDDWWFHARGVPGAHVIVRTEHDTLPKNTIQRAAELAAFYSKLQQEENVLVDYTLRRHVRRIAGAAPGLVTYSQEQTIRVTPRDVAPEE